MATRTRAPVFCERYCPICRAARAGSPLFQKIQRLELKIFGERGCPFGRARTAYYGIPPHQTLPRKSD